MKWVFRAACGLALLFGASLVSAYLYGSFAEDAVGKPSYALPQDGPPTLLDQKIGALEADHASETGLTLVSSNLDAFAARALSARAAGRSLDVMYYIWKDDLTGTFLLRELLDAAERGVRVRLLLDDIGVAGHDEALVTLAAHANISVRLFNPTRARENTLRRGIEMALRFASVNRRMHNKAWIADGRVAVVGGRNVGDAYFDAGEDSHFRDLDLIVTGPVLDETEAMFDAFWNSGLALPVTALSSREAMPQADLRAAFDARLGEDAVAPYTARIRERVSVFSLFDEDRIHWTRDARLLADPPEKATGEVAGNGLMEEVVPLLLSARQNLEIVSPYFVPGDEGAAELADLARSGTRVSILTNSLAATDVAAVHGGYAPYRERLLQGGVELHELRPDGPAEPLSFRGSSQASLHTKAFTVDDRLGFVGSLNFDPRSASLNTEMGVLFEAPELVAAVREIFADETAPEHSYAVSLAPDGGLLWTSEENGRPIVVDREPEAGFLRRAVAKVVALLPLESQL